jgi:chromosome segregation ATPase
MNLEGRKNRLYNDCDEGGWEDAMADIRSLIAEVRRQAKQIGRIEVDRELAEYDKEKAEVEVKRLKDCLQHVTGNYAPYDRERARADKAEAELAEAENKLIGWNRCATAICDALKIQPCSGEQLIKEAAQVKAELSACKERMKELEEIMVKDAEKLAKYMARQALQVQEQTKKVG